MFAELIANLEAALEAVKKADQDLRIPRQEVGIGYALKQLRNLLGDEEYISIQPPEFKWYRASDPVTCEEWAVWDGEAHFTGNTLAEAVAKVIAAHSQTAPDSPASVETMLAQAMDPVPL